MTKPHKPKDSPNVKKQTTSAQDLAKYLAQRQIGMFFLSTVKIAF
jgi:hypothetical protein